MHRKNCFYLIFVVVLFRCEPSVEDDGFYVFSEVFNFNEGPQGWQGDFADYPVDDSIFYELNYAHANLPVNLGLGKALLLSGNNHSDDLFMFLKKKITGLTPNCEYNASFEVKFATNAAKNSVGVGGSPGESVFLKAGVSDHEPLKINEDGYYRMNLDKGNQSTRGENSIVIGTIGSAYTDGSDYALETRTNLTSIQARANQNGDLWILVGTDSGFEGTTTIYYTEISLVFTNTE